MKFFKDERSGAVVMLLAAAFGFLLCNLGWAELASFKEEAWPLVSQLGMALFFALIGLELLAEFDDGLFKNRLSIAVPALAALAGVVIPGAVYVALALLLGGGSLANGWPIVTATDVSFALMVFSLFAKGLPSGLRAFLLSFAVIDDIFASIALAVSFARLDALIPLISTVGSIAIALLLRRSQRETVVRFFSPFVAFLVLPVFGFFAMQIRFDAGAVFAGSGAVLIPLIFSRPLTKWVGVFVGATVGQRLMPQNAKLDLSTADLLSVSSLAGIGFTVSLLAADLAFGVESQLFSAAAAITVVAAMVSAGLAAIALRARRAAK
ncbi:MAG: Na+/H+ antiporter NhaA [Actinomycetota bacterium]|jgi:NhaA family Na+:H+ antiporter